MHDPWTDRLSAYIDDDLTAAEAAALERHLATCDECRVTLDELRQVLAEARTLPQAGPGHDLWPGIAAAIAAERKQTDVLPLNAARRRRLSLESRFSFSVPQLAAAAMILMSVGAGAVWWLSGGAGAGTRTAAEASGVILHTATAPATDPRLVSTQPPADVDGYDADIAALERALAGSRDRLDPATIEVVERSLDAIDQAIADARAALESDPANPHLQRQLESTMQKKLALLRRASGASRGGA